MTKWGVLAVLAVGAVPDGPRPGGDERRDLAARRGLRHDRDHDPDRDRALRAGDGGADGHGRQARRHLGPAARVHDRARIYAFGSGLTAASWSVPALMLGWSILEGIGAALVLPALVALAAGNYRGRDRAVAYGVLGGVAGAGIAVGPILGGWATDRADLAGGVRRRGRGGDRDPARHEADPRARRAKGGAAASTGSARCSPRSGLALIVLGVLQASNWGWLRAAQLAGRAVRLLAHAVRDRGGRPRPGGVPRLAAPPRGARAASRWSTSGCSRSRRCAAGSRCCSPRT